MSGLMSALSDYGVGAVRDMGVLTKLIRKLSQPLTNPNWDQEVKLLVREVERTEKSLKDLKRSLTTSGLPTKAE